MKLRYLAVFYGCLGLAAAEPVGAQTLSTFGTPGLIDLPTAQVLEDGEVALTTNYFGNNTRNTLTFQVLPRVYGSFRYSILRNFNEGSPTAPENFYDRSFDVHFQMAFETETTPGLAFGLRDFGGTGRLSSEYVVATKSFGDRFTVTGGMGWGRLAQRGEFRNPLSYIFDSFRTRPEPRGIEETGQLDTGAWFRGPAAIFAGVEYQATDRLSFQLEYSTDAYDDEVERGLVDIESPFNVGLNYTFSSGSNLRAFVIGGREIGLQYSYVFNPKNPRAPGGFDKAPLPIGNRSEATLADMQLSDRKSLTRARQLMQERLEEEGMTLEGFVVDGPRATIRIENTLWGIEAQAIGRAARVMANTLPSNIDTFIITTQEFGVPNSTITLQRDDLRELQTDVDGAWRSLSRSQIEDADPDTRDGEIDGLYPKFFYGFGPFTRFSFFDPDEPLRFDFGAQLAMSYRPNPGLSFDMLLRQPVIGNIDEATRRSDSVLPRVRSDAALYAIESDLEINRLTAEYMFKPRENVFGRVSAGYLEAMYAGVSGELLWYPIDSPLALGVEINYVRQRDFDMLFGLQDYDVVTGHASAYYDFRSGFVAQVDAGRYLAGDWGATLGIDREFNNGFKIGGYFTLTDVSFEDFGEGSFDKGIRMTIPLSWLTGKPSRENYGRTIQPVTRDGGARLFVANRLYGVTRDNRAIGLNNGWGRFYR
ncbi:YjbH domain-containing protein [Tateyamaria sp. Alg231-49]|uniref:YjbH domain-containing protein n=1 Tax=Tateyamaria sp. Alg231-49 TaxID=1922219 RepID=UPI000D55F9AF|nr:YjbH domain-containing protein [Tateyamaria sp. Alg231-49]